MSDFFGLKDKTVVITGASGGVGSESARVFTRVAGAKVALLSRRGAGELAKELSSEGFQAKSYSVDVTDREGLAETFREINADLGPVYSLLNISGTCDFYPDDATPREKTVVDDDRWQKIIDVNGKGVALAVQYAMESMEEGGTIVNVASTSGRYGGEMAVVDYSFSKAGLIGFTLGYSKILAPLGIRVNAVAPGPIEGTEMLSGADDSALDRMRSSIRLGRLCTTLDIARINLFLASKMSNAMTGETLDANCGQFIAY